MTNNFYPPITPTPEMVRQWRYEDSDEVVMSPRWFHIVCTKAARWGADQQLDMDAEQINQAWQKGADDELEACCEFLNANCYQAAAKRLRSARRHKPPSLKAQALAVLDDASDRLDAAHENTIRRALESLRE